MARYYLIAFLCAPMSVMGGGEARATEPIEEDIEQVYGRDEDTISIATGYRKPLDLAPSVATVITEEEIQAIGATTLGQVIETVAGIHTTNAVDSVVTVRGITSRVLVLLNNVPVAQGLFVNAFAQLDNIQINDIERIEVIRGPGSAVYGADAFAGVINIVTKTSKDINGTEVGARAGSFDTYDGWLLHGGEYGGFDVALSVSGRTTDGFDATVEADAQTAFDALFGTRASRAPGPLNVDKDLIDARAEVSRGPWTLRAGTLGNLMSGPASGCRGP